MNTLKPLNETIAAIHDDHDIDEKVTKKITEAVKEHFEKHDSAQELQLQTIADHLANARFAEATQLAVLHCKRDPEKAVDQDKAIDGQALHIEH